MCNIQVRFFEIVGELLPSVHAPDFCLAWQNSFKVPRSFPRLIDLLGSRTTRAVLRPCFPDMEFSHAHYLDHRVEFPPTHP